MTCIVILLFTAALGGSAALAQSGPAPASAGVRDFAAYWAASRLLLDHQNPYSPSALFDLQRAAGLRESDPLIMWNPPWTLAFTLPFGLLDFSTGQFLWLLTHVFLTLWSAGLLWRMYGNSEPRMRWPWLLSFTFVPAIFVLVLGQITPLVLAGLAAFAHTEKKRMDLASGAALALALVKPHFIYLFWIVLLFWVMHQRRWRIALGAAAAGLLAATIPLLFDSMIYAEYIALFQRADLHLPMDLAAPTVRSVTKHFFQIETPWLHVALSAGAGIWSVAYWHARRDNWQWAERLPLLLLVSLATSPYAWTFDQVVFLLAILRAGTWAIRRQRPWFTSSAVVLYLSIEVAQVLLRFFVAEDIWYFWLAPALLANYLVFLWESGGTNSETARAAAKSQIPT